MVVNRVGMEVNGLIRLLVGWSAEADGIESRESVERGGRGGRGGGRMDDTESENANVSQTKDIVVGSQSLCSTRRARHFPCADPFSGGLRM